MTRRSKPARVRRELLNFAAAAGARQRRHNVVGLLIIGGLAVVAMLIFFMDPLLGLLRDDVEIIAVFESAPDVVSGAPVWIAGRQVGEVSSVEFLPVPDSGNPRLALYLAVPRDNLRLIRRDAQVEVTAARMIGEPVIDILPGSAAAPPFTLGDTLHPRRAITSREVMRRAAAVQAAMDSLLVASAPVSALARERMVGLARIQAGFAGTQRELAELSTTLATSPVLALAQDPAVARALARLRAAGADMRALTAEDADVARVQQAFAPLTHHAEQLSARLDSLRALSVPNGTLHRMQNDSALAVAIRGAQAQLDSLIIEAQRNPLRFVF